jgi:NAD(P)-dependent dehydrogenase (short-subunit alcohol dehydrogenase family)
MSVFVVTGVSSGIGAAIAKGLIGRGHVVFGTVRRPDDGARLQSQLGPNFTPLIADVTDAAALEAAAVQVASALKGKPLAGLVNNAGIALPGSLIDQPLERFEQHLAVNLVGPLKAARAFLDLLVPAAGAAGVPGRIVNISSVAGRFSGPFLGAYSASKHGLEGLSDALRRELMLLGVDVIVVAPGAVRTPIWDKAEADSARDPTMQDASRWSEAQKRLERWMLDRGRVGMPAEAVADVVIRALTAHKVKTRYALGSSAFGALAAFVPVRVLDRVLARRFGLTRDA